MKKICIKKIYCSSCRKLVRGREQATENNVQVNCARCDSPLWLWNGIYCRYLAKKA